MMEVKMLSVLAYGNYRTMVHRHRKANMIIRTKEGTGTVTRPTSGGMQGDKPMPEQFSTAYDPTRLELWIGYTRKGEDLEE